MQKYLSTYLIFTMYKIIKIFLTIVTSTVKNTVIKKYKKKGMKIENITDKVYLDLEFCTFIKLKNKPFVRGRNAFMFSDPLEWTFNLRLIFPPAAESSDTSGRQIMWHQASDVQILSGSNDSWTGAEKQSYKYVYAWQGSAHKG